MSPMQLSDAELQAVVDAWIRREGARPDRRPDNPILPLLENVLQGGDFAPAIRETERQLRHTLLNLQAAMAALDPDAERIVYAVLGTAERACDELWAACHAASTILEGSAPTPVLN